MRFSSLKYQEFLMPFFNIAIKYQKFFVYFTICYISQFLAISFAWRNICALYYAFHIFKISEL